MKEEADRAANPEKYEKLDEEKKRAERDVVISDRRHDSNDKYNGSKRSRDDGKERREQRKQICKTKRKMFNTRRE